MWKYSTQRIVSTRVNITERPTEYENTVYKGHKASMVSSNWS